MAGRLGGVVWQVRAKPKELLKILALIGGGVAMLLTGAWIAFDGYRFLETAESASGHVIDVVAKRGSRGLNLYHPVVRFHPDDATSPIEFTAGASPWESLYEPGERVEVAYQVADPADARIRSFWMLWFLPVLTALFGAACVLAGFHERIASRR